MTYKSSLLYFPPSLARRGSQPWKVPEHLEKGAEAEEEGEQRPLFTSQGPWFHPLLTPCLPPSQLPGGSQYTWRTTSSDFPEPRSLKASHWYSPLIFLVTEDRVNVGVSCSLSRVPSLSQAILRNSGLLLMTWQVMVTDSPSVTLAPSGLTSIFNFGTSRGAEGQ